MEAHDYFTAEKRRIAVHEAGHVVASLALGRRLTGPVSIRPGRHFAGVMFHSSGSGAQEGSSDSLGAPVPLLPARLRHDVETSIMVSLAGPEAERWLLERKRVVRAVRSEDQKVAERLARVVSLSEREREILRAAEERDEPPSEDEEVAWEWAWCVAGDQTAAAYVAWLRQVTRHLLLSPSNARAVLALSDELLRAEVISARGAREIVEREKGA